MRWSGNNVVALVAMGLGVLAYLRISSALRAAGEGLGIIGPDLGPPTTLTPSGRGREADFIRAGYLERLPDGSTRITDAGEAYIELQRQQREGTL